MTDQCYCQADAHLSQTLQLATVNWIFYYYCRQFSLMARVKNFIWSLLKIHMTGGSN